MKFPFTTRRKYDRLHDLYLKAMQTGISRKLTAEQVRESIERHSAWVIGNNRRFHDGAYEEIADELNAALESSMTVIYKESIDFDRGEND